MKIKNNTLKKFEDYENKMPLPTIRAFAKYGFITYQLHKQLPNITKEK